MKEPLLRKFDVFRRIVSVKRTESGWLVLYGGSGELSRPAEDIKIPPSIKEDEIADYLAVLCHEWSSPPKSRIWSNCLTSKMSHRDVSLSIIEINLQASFEIPRN